MKWSPEQDRALVAVSEWLKDPDQQIFRLFGFAGTGKTTLARYFAEGVDGEVLFGAYTGKAAYVLLQMGCVGATTIHAHIYYAKDKARVKLKELEAELATVLHELRQELSNDSAEDQDTAINADRAVRTLRGKIEAEHNTLSQPMFTLNTDSAVKDAALLIVDEVMMVDDRMGADLLSFGTKVLVLGDPAQLPPIYGAGFFESDKPNIMLTEIHRQAANSPIIAMATQIRQGIMPAIGKYGESEVMELCHINAGIAKAADQILVGRNRTRHTYNNRLRVLKGIMDPLPVPGDRLVCLRNNHDLGLLNGAIWYADDIGETGEERMYMTISPEGGGNPLGVEAHTHYFRGAEESLAWYERKEAEEFDYGYALTVHKAQGSQWDDVLLFDESYCFRKDRWRWLYTGVTRAAERVIIVKT